MRAVGRSELLAQPRLLLLPLLRKLLQLRGLLPLLVQLRPARRALDATRGSGAVLSAPLGTTGEITGAASGASASTP